MTVWGLLAPKGWTLASTVAAPAAIAGITFSNTLTLGAVIVAAFVIILSGAFTLRTNIQSYWRGLAEERQQKIAALEEELRESEKRTREITQQAREDMLTFTEEQRAVRHELRNEVAAAKALLQVEQAKTDLTGLMEQLSTQHTEAMQQISAGIAQQQDILKALAPIAELAVRLTRENDDRANGHGEE